MISTAPASVGKPKWNACSTAWIIRLSSISSAAGTIPAAMIPLTVSVAASTRVEDAQQGPARLGVAGQVDDDLGDDAEGPLVADDQAGQVVARVVLGDAAGLDDRAVGHDELDAPDVVDRHAVLERVRPARVGRDVAADRAGRLAGRVGGVMEARAGQRPGEPDVDDARLDDRVAVAGVDLEDPLHPGQADHHPAADGERPARQARPAPLGDERDARGGCRALTTSTTCAVVVGKTTTSGTFFSMT